MAGVRIAGMDLKRISVLVVGTAGFILGFAGGCGGPHGSVFRDAEQRDAALRDILETRSYMLGRPTAMKLTPDGSAALFLRSGSRDRVQNLYEYDVASGQTRELLTAAKLLGGGSESLSVEERARRERQRVTAKGIAGYQLSEDGTLLLVPLSGKLYVVERAGGAVHELAGVRDALDPRFSPDGRWVSYVADYDLYRADWRTGAIERLTTGGTVDTPNGLAEFVAQEEMGRSAGYWWSPESELIACQHSDLRDVETLYIPDPAHANRAPQSWRYPRAGTNNAKVGLAILKPGTDSRTEVKWDVERYPYLAAVTWTKNAPLTIVVQARDQKDELVLRVDAASGATSELLREHDDSWVNLNRGMPRWLESGSGFLWITEKDGEVRLWLYDADGRAVRALNDDSFRLGNVIDVDEAAKLVWVSGATDPTTRDVWVLGLDALRVERPTPKGGFNEQVAGFTTLAVSKDHGTGIVTISGPRSMPRSYVRRLDGRSGGGQLPSVAEEPPFAPRVEFTRVGPKGEFDASIVRPRNFAAGRKYPVIVDVYGGPSDGEVKKDARPYFLPQWYADQGFVVVSADNRGISGRGRAWERAIYGNFADVPLEDQVAALKALGAKYPEMDMARVGIKGWSFGGYETAIATIRRGDVFAAGAAGAPVVDWSDYDTHYTERYLNLPSANADGYKRSSILTYAGELKRPLLIIHGTADDNVYFANSLKLTDALMRAGKAYEFMPLAGYTHMVPDAATRVLVEERIAGFFRKTLQGGSS